MDLDTWVELDRTARARVCEGVASQVGGTLRGVDDQTLPVATFDVRGHEMVLVPGGVVTLGWDGREVALDPAARARWSAESESGVGSFEEYLRHFLEPARTVTLAPFLLERSPAHVEELFDPYEVDDPEEELRTRIAAEGFRLPSGDEWEHAVRAGASGLFPWGDEWPSGIPHGRETSFRGHEESSRLGLELLADPYQVEIVAERDHVRGGDGGTAICGGQPWPAAWVSFALAFRWPRTAWEGVVAELFETAHVRRALGPLRVVV